MVFKIVSTDSTFDPRQMPHGRFLRYIKLIPSVSSLLPSYELSVIDLLCSN